MPNSGDDMTAEERARSSRALADQLLLLNALLTAGERRNEILDTVGQATDRDDAQARLQDRFGFHRHQALVVLDMQVRRFTQEGQAEIARRRDEVRSLLESLDESPD